MSDLISRQAAIDALDGVKVDEENCTEYDIGYNDGIDFAVSKLSVLPLVQPERKKGEWIRNDNGTYSCSVCQSWIPEEQQCYARYCLYCGAEMKGEQDE